MLGQPKHKLLWSKKEFLPKLNGEHDGYAWASFGKWPKPLHQGLRNTLQNKTNIPSTKLKSPIQIQEVFLIIILHIQGTVIIINFM